MTKKENFEKCKNLLYSSIVNFPLAKDDFEYLTTQIFPLHPRWKEKCNGRQVRSVIVHKHPEYHNLCFALVLDNNSVIDISFIECINKTGLIKDITLACHSIVTSINPEEKLDSKIIKEWIKTFDNEELTVGKYLTTDIEQNKIFNNTEIIENFKEFYKNYV